MFSFGMASAGDSAVCNELLASGLRRLPTVDHVAAWLGRAFDHRIRQALDGKPPAGPLPIELMRRLEAMGRDGPEEKRKNEKNLRYKIDRLREHSSILEPHERVSPYRHWHGPHTDDVARDLARVVDLNDRDETRELMDRLLATSSLGAKPALRQCEILGTALELGYRLGEPFAQGLFGRVIPVVDALDPLGRRAQLLERAIKLAAHFGQNQYVVAYVNRFERLLADVTTRDHKELEPVLRECVRGLRKLGLRDVIDRLLDRITRAVLGDQAGAESKDLSGLAVRAGAVASDWSRALRLLLHVAAGWCHLGQPERAFPVYDEARRVLLDGDLPPIDQTALACAYARTLSPAPTNITMPRLVELFTSLQRVHDTYTVNSHYSLSRLDLIESVVFTVTSEEFTWGEAGIRWIEDDEYLVRRRIHRDVHAALGEPI
jgi:hypothetical protein